jgi:hypothetical protein
MTMTLKACDCVLNMKLPPYLGIPHTGRWRHRYVLRAPKTCTDWSVCVVPWGLLSHEGLKRPCNPLSHVFDYLLKWLFLTCCWMYGVLLVSPCRDVECDIFWLTTRLIAWDVCNTEGIAFPSQERYLAALQQHPSGRTVLDPIISQSEFCREMEASHNRSSSNRSGNSSSSSHRAKKGRGSGKAAKKGRS